ncbi:hypothetical protein LI90_369 [Carbonactinospora thermoautotrophica]|uniref:Uncharacterized protein n=1 Tax=Carbonactinospora thermoautotrophica TaxID=1469144 RepID=A0A132MLK1_9ACTN|nr:hypothetical protein [Carbonactinospora thermoautotrophica]KWW98740.1 hypothetical protein LI90_369 [Carbonactinospora thermoautotrophica]
MSPMPNAKNEKAGMTSAGAADVFTAYQRSVASMFGCHGRGRCSCAGGRGCDTEAWAYLLLEYVGQ